MTSEETPAAKIAVARYRRSFGQPKRKRPTSPRRIPWPLSRVRQQKHATGIIHWLALILGRDIVSRRLLEGMYDKLERNGQLDTLTAPAAPEK